MRPSHAEALRKLIASGDTFVLPGVFDALSAGLVRQAGFKAVYASGGAISRTLGYPDIGLVTMSEMASHLRYIVDAAELPVVSDADDGYGGPLSVWRTVRAFGQVGVAALHIEDQAAPKRCGHLDGKALVGVSQMVEKLIAAKEAAEPFGTLIIARTDAIAVEGFEAALARSIRYAEAGADMIFVEAPETVEQIERIAEAIKQPKVLNMFKGGKTPYLEDEQLALLGYNLVIVPSNLQRAVIGCMRKMLKCMWEGENESVASMLPPIEDRDTAVEMDRFELMERRYQN